jgi:hypothetical protein
MREIGPQRSPHCVELVGSSSTAILWDPVCSRAFETAAHSLRLAFPGEFER